MTQVPAPEKKWRGGLLRWIGVAAAGCIGLGMGFIRSAGSDRLFNATPELTVYCAASMRAPIEEIAGQFTEQTGQAVSLQFGGSGSLLANISIFRCGDVFVAADSSYIERLQAIGGVRQVYPVAKMQPVLAVAVGNPLHIHQLKDLLREDVRVGLGNPEVAAIGRLSERVFREAGLWDRLQSKLLVTKPTVSDIANDLALGAIDATLIWDVVAEKMQDRLDSLVPPELSREVEEIQLAVLDCSTQKTNAENFAKFVLRNSRARQTLLQHGFRLAEATPAD